MGDLMNKLLTVLLIVLFTVSCVKQVRNEKYYQDSWCFKNKGKTEFRLSDKTRVDCLTQTHAIEFDFAEKWAEAIGQSLHYARMAGKSPGIVYICRTPEDLYKIERAERTIKAYNLPIKVWRVNCN